MPIVVGTPRILADLAAVDLLQAAASLPRRLYVPDVMEADALSLVPGARRDHFRRAGCRVATLDGAEAAIAFGSASRHRVRLAASSAFALTFASLRAGLLLTDDDGLVSAARAEGVGTRDLDWLASLIARHGRAGRETIDLALRSLASRIRVEAGRPPASPEPALTRLRARSGRRAP